MAQGLNLEPPVNALQRAMSMAGMRDQNALRQMQMQQMQAAAQQSMADRQKAAEQEAMLKAAISRIPSPRLAPLGGNAAPT
ncbi:hypothetical protein OE165_27345, partial [Escherichia coli]|uniref:hypothetical protein n=1 Tax=Escherichia coli TaxID=562 RepID=UPI0021F34927